MQKLNRSRLQMFFKVDVLKNVLSSTGRRLRWSVFLIMLLARRPTTFLKDSKASVLLQILRNF